MVEVQIHELEVCTGHKASNAQCNNMGTALPFRCTVILDVLCVASFVVLEMHVRKCCGIPLVP